jgi:hypothetical protein
VGLCLAESNRYNSAAVRTDKWTACADDDQRFVVGYLILYPKEETCVDVMAEFDESG